MSTLSIENRPIVDCDPSEVVVRNVTHSDRFARLPTGTLCGARGPPRIINNNLDRQISEAVACTHQAGTKVNRRVNGRLMLALKPFKSVRRWPRIRWDRFCHLLTREFAPTKGSIRSPIPKERTSVCFSPLLCGTRAALKRLDQPEVKLSPFFTKLFDHISHNGRWFSDERASFRFCFSFLYSFFYFLFFFFLSEKRFKEGRWTNRDDILSFGVGRYVVTFR